MWEARRSVPPKALDFRGWRDPSLADINGQACLDFVHLCPSKLFLLPSSLPPSRTVHPPLLIYPSVPPSFSIIPISPSPSFLPAQLRGLVSEDADEITPSFPSNVPSQVFLAPLLLPPSTAACLVLEDFSKMTHSLPHSLPSSLPSSLPHSLPHFLSPFLTLQPRLLSFPPQLRGLVLEDADKVIAGLHVRGLSSFQSGMDNVRNVTGSPIAGLDPHELLDSRPVCKGECVCESIARKKKGAGLPPALLG